MPFINYADGKKKLNSKLNINYADRKGLICIPISPVTRKYPMSANDTENFVQLEMLIYADLEVSKYKQYGIKDI